MEEQWVAPTASEMEEIQYYEQIAAEAQARSDAERRRNTRQNFAAEITASSATNFFMGFSEDISEGGLFLSTMSPPDVGEVITLVVKVGEESVEVQGEVRWHRFVTNVVTGCGIAFKQLQPEAQVRFEKILLDLQKEPLFFEV